VRYFAKLCLSPYGNTIVLTSSEPRSGRGEATNVFTTRFLRRTESGWSEPEFIEQTFGFLAPSISSQGTLYFFLEVPGKMDIYMSRISNGIYEKPLKLGDAINSEHDEVDPFVAPDESFLIFCRSGEGFGSMDLFISFRNEDGSWSKAKNMGETINSEATDFCPSVSPDGKYMFFSSSRNSHKFYSDIPLTYEKKIEILSSPGNGFSDIYWVNAGIIEKLRSEEK
jgi:Tol biopolymer transport system component